jgi:uncharacterized protein YqjF (DUF2071 family)
MNESPRVFLRARWRWLLMLNYRIDPEVLRPLVPRGTELDLWRGSAYVSMVGFRFLDTRVKGCRIPFHVNFDEVNLRFYVRRFDGSGWRRGVVFVKEIVPRWAIAFVARTIYNENYVALPMRSRLELPEGGKSGSLEYAWKENRNWPRMSAKIDGEAKPVAPDSEEFFITEHYWGYSRQKDGSTMEYQVEHPPWKVWNASEAKFECDVEYLYGERFVSCLAAQPTSAFVAEGSDVSVRKGTKLD